ncbi:redox-sensing transcriptional repressor Rex [candidate division KSB1 bacterium]|nr:redox-sensing transcriptional repressor Rex [candidate division KSB1 bacterium]
MKTISEKTIERLIIYRGLLLNLVSDKVKNIFSHQLATMTGFTSAQIRRDIMSIGYSGSPVRGYDIQNLIKSLGEFIDGEEKQPVALVGLGHVGRAVLDYLKGRRPKLEITASFDDDPAKVDRVFQGCMCYHVNDLEKIIEKENIKVGIIAVPADEAQSVAERMANAGIKGILNYAPVKLNIPSGIYVENRDMTLAVEKVAYFARTASE